MLDTPVELLTGFLHPLISPIHGLGILAVGLCVSTLSGRSLFEMGGLFVLGLYLGGFILIMSGPFEWTGPAVAALTALSALIAIIAKPPLGLIAVTLAAAGFCHGAGNLLDVPVEANRTGFLSGVIAAMVLGALAIRAGLRAIPHHPGLIVRRIGASWVIAIALLIGVVGQLSP